MSRRWYTLLLAMLLGTQLGNACSPGGGASGPAASLSLEFGPATPIAAGSYVVVGTVKASAIQSYQAYDVDLQWSPSGPNQLGSVNNLIAFSQDAQLARTPLVDQNGGTITGLIDARHGPNSAVTGTVKLFHVTFVVFDGSDITVEVVGDLARPDGTKFVTAPSGAVLVQAPGS